MDLIKPVIPDNRWHPNYKHILLDHYRCHLDKLSEWASGFLDRDNKFVKEFLPIFNPCFWELYLFAVLKDFGLNVDWSHNSPDFAVESDFCNFSIEETTAYSAQDRPNEWDVIISEIDVSAVDLNDLSREPNSASPRRGDS